MIYVLTAAPWPGAPSYDYEERNALPDWQQWIKIGTTYDYRTLAGRCKRFRSELPSVTPLMTFAGYEATEAKVHGYLYGMLEEEGKKDPMGFCAEKAIEYGFPCTYEWFPGRFADELFFSLGKASPDTSLNVRVYEGTRLAEARNKVGVRYFRSESIWTPFEEWFEREVQRRSNPPEGEAA